MVFGRLVSYLLQDSPGNLRIVFTSGTPEECGINVLCFGMGSDIHLTLREIPNFMGNYIASKESHGTLNQNTWLGEILSLMVFALQYVFLVPYEKIYNLNFRILA